MKNYNHIIINNADNVAVALEDTDKIPKGHKAALCDIPEKAWVIKYGEIIGYAKAPIKKGEWVHTHNLASHLDEDRTYTYNFSAEEKSHTKKTFMGYKRVNGRAGIRNEIYIIATVGCVNNVCRKLERMAQKLICGSIDGIFALTHQFGCSQLGEDNENIKNLLVSIAKNPNASFVLFVGLGCENNSLEGIKNELSGRDNISFFNCQDVEDELSYGYEILCGFAEKAKQLSREEVDFSELCIGLKCGGSDGLSGITANPLVGKISDKTVSYGGSVILSEAPEMFGAEQILMNKCESEEVYESFCNMINDYRAFYKSQGFPVYENPSPGNKKGGITTLEEKSLGCIKKAGNSKIVDVLKYAENVERSGVSVLHAPGNDLVSATALAGAGCQLILFTTGRGTPFSTFVPTMKIASNGRLSSFKSGWIDFNAESGTEDELFALIEKTVTGEYKCKSEDIREIAFFKTGVTL